MLIELASMGLKAERQCRIIVYYEGHVVGEYCADITVNDAVICELKAKEFFIEDDDIQLINYLKATNIEVGLLLNFGKKPEIKRKIFDNERKSWRTTKITAI